jgi:hypothetical protein
MLKPSVCALCAVLASTTLAGQSSALGSLFDRYDVSAAWAKVTPGEGWGASTSSVAADGQGSVVVLVRAAPYCATIRSSMSSRSTAVRTG